MPLPYIAQSDLEAVIGPDDFLQLTDRANNPPTTPDATVIATAIAAATGRVHKYVTRRYALPLDSTDAILLAFIKPILVDYAWEALFPRADMVPRDLSDRNAAHDKELDSIRDGDADLPASTPAATRPAGGESGPIFNTCGAQFNGLP